MLNKVILIGNLGTDPEVKAFPNGGGVTNFSLATSRKWKDKNGERQEETEWHRISIFGKLGEVAERFLRKGSKVYLEGRIHTRKWQDGQGNDRYSTEIIAHEMLMLGEKTGQAPQREAPKDVENDASFDDDIPF